MGYGVDIRAPRPPFVAVKVAWRWMGVGGVVGMGYRMLRALVRLVAGLVGYLVGLVMGGEGGEGNVGEIPPRSGWVGVGDDEVL